MVLDQKQNRSDGLDQARRSRTNKKSRQLFQISSSRKHRHRSSDSQRVVGPGPTRNNLHSGAIRWSVRHRHSDSQPNHHWKSNAGYRRDSYRDFATPCGSLIFTPREQKCSPNCRRCSSSDNFATTIAQSRRSRSKRLIDYSSRLLSGPENRRLAWYEFPRPLSIRIRCAASSIDALAPIDIEHFRRKTKKIASFFHVHFCSR